MVNFDEVSVAHFGVLKIFERRQGPKLKMTMEMGFSMGMGIPWKSHGNGN